MKTKQQKTMTATQVELILDKLTDARNKVDNYFVKINLVDDSEAFNVYYDIKRSYSGSFMIPALQSGKSVVIPAGIEVHFTYFKLRAIVENYKVVSIQVIK